MTKKPHLELRKEWYKLSSIWVLEERIKDQNTEKAKSSWVTVVIEEAKTAPSESLLIKIGSVSIEVNSDFNPDFLNRC